MRDGGAPRSGGGVRGRLAARPVVAPLPWLRLAVDHARPGRVRFRIHCRLSLPVVSALVVRALARVSPHVELTYSPASGRYLATSAPDVPLRAALQALAAGPPPSRAELAALARDATTPPQDAPSAPAWKGALRIVAPMVARFLLAGRLTPPALRPILTAVRVLPLLRSGLAEVARGKLGMAALDGAAVGAALGMGDSGTARTIAFLLQVGGTLEEWARAQARRNLVALFRGTEQPAWVLRDGVEREVPAAALVPGDRVVVRMGGRIPVDGVVESGEALVNQSVMTGEAQAFAKRPGLSVYAGTVVEAGQLVVVAQRTGDATRFSRAAQLIEGAETLKGESVSETERLARRAVPWTFLTAGAVLLLTRNPARAASVLVVDYSCALKLATPLALKAAMFESATRGAVVKGGRPLERLAKADVFVFDKTGTVTEARPRVAGVYPMDGFSRAFVLRTAACLEEHFPHPVATAVVEQARREGLRHEERHTRVEYVLAHGIATTLDGERTVVGSRHFVTEHERADVSPAAALAAAAVERGQSVLYLATGGRLAGILTIEDPLLPQAPAVVRRLRDLGSARVVLLTGGEPRAAKAVADALGIEEYYAEVLPDDKTRVIERLQAGGATVAMVGDGINDTAALARADVGISLDHAADLAREASDVVLLEGRLEALPDAIRISRRAVRRMRRNFTFSVGANSVFLGLGLLGLAPTALLAVLHNASTVATSFNSLRPYLGTGRAG